MSSTELAVPERIAMMDKIARLWLTGTRNPTSIAREVGLKRAEVLEYIEEYRAVARNDEDIKDRAKEALFEADESLHLVIQELWGVVNETQDGRVKAAALKSIADVDIKRVETLQKAGLYGDAAMGDEIAAMEEKQAILMSILKEVTAHCENCKFEVARRLAKVSGTTAPAPDDGRVYEGVVTE
jgi:hypothetical protein